MQKHGLTILLSVIPKDSMIQPFRKEHDIMQPHLSEAEIIEAYEVMIIQGWTKKELDDLYETAKENIIKERGEE
jgi:hypothetical protein